MSICRIQIFAILLLTAGHACVAQENERQTDSLATLKTQIIESFKKTHDGWSSDEVILQDELNEAFVTDVKKQLPNASTEEIGWTLINLRKAGKLTAKATRRDNRSTSSVSHLAEIAARTVMDQSGASTDKIMTSPKLRAAFNAEVTKLSPSADLYLARKAAYKLRKARSLRPELITRIADWNKKITNYTIGKLRKSLDDIPEYPGVYVFRDNTGYLYFGQAENLRKRLQTHLDESHNQSLANYLKQSDNEISIEIHAFDPDSPAKKVMVRRAYESDLIRSRKPRFNILP